MLLASSGCVRGESIYGGLWTERIVSGMRAISLADAMPRIEAAGYPMVPARAR